MREKSHLHRVEIEHHNLEKVHPFNQWNINPSKNNKITKHHNLGGLQNLQATPLGLSVKRLSVCSKPNRDFLATEASTHRLDSMSFLSHLHCQINFHLHFNLSMRKVRITKSDTQLLVLLKIPNLYCILKRKYWYYKDPLMQIYKLRGKRKAKIGVQQIKIRRMLISLVLLVIKLQMTSKLEAQE